MYESIVPIERKNTTNSVHTDDKAGTMRPDNSRTKYNTLQKSDEALN